MWSELLSNRRLGSRDVDQVDARSPFQRDFDRIVFSSAFRRLQDKTQVFPLPSSDYVRTRLTHSLEVATIGRSLGVMTGAEIKKRYRRELRDFDVPDFGAIVAAACLAHDIGNPPFGHSGEAAIRNWFANASVGQAALKGLSPREAADLQSFEGNAQGFRVLTKLQTPDNHGGLQLTHATLGTFLKYPREASLASDALVSQGQSTSKNGYFQDERRFVSDLAMSLGLVVRSAKPVSWARHPLAFLVEAADDISYRIIDFEDGFRLGHVEYKEAAAKLLALLDRQGQRRARQRLRTIAGPKDRIEYLRARAINALIGEVVEIFLDEEKRILSGKFDAELVSLIPKSRQLRSIRELSKEKVYSVRNVVEIEAAGFEVLGGLLDHFVPALLDVGRRSTSKRNEKYFRLLPARAQKLYGNKSASDYQRLLIATDFISGMTDSYAVSMFKTIRGISIPTS
jgi:dGTPase